MLELKFLSQGEGGLVIEFGDKIEPSINDKVHRLFRNILKEYQNQVEAVIPTYRSILILFDPLQVTREKLVEMISMIANVENTDEQQSIVRNIVTIPTLYGGEAGPDLQYVASYNKLEPEEVISLHTSISYRIYMMGFTPGFPYLGGLSERIATPRLTTPRQQIPAGSVGIAGSQTGLYPQASPGGWQLIGRTPVKVFDPLKNEPFLYKAGDYLQFESIDTEEFNSIAKDVEQGRFVPKIKQMR